MSIAVAKVTQIPYSEARPQSCWRAEAGSVGIQRLRNDTDLQDKESVQHGDRIFRQESKYLVLYRFILNHTQAYQKAQQASEDVLAALVLTGESSKIPSVSPLKGHSRRGADSATYQVQNLAFCNARLGFKRPFPSKQADILRVHWVQPKESCGQSLEGE